MAGRPSSGPAAYSDRFIPSRAGSGDFQSAYELLRSPLHDANDARAPTTVASAAAAAARADRGCYSMLLRSELLDDRAADVCPNAAEPTATRPPRALDALKRAPDDMTAAARGSLFRFRAAPARPLSAPAASGTGAPRCAEVARASGQWVGALQGVDGARKVHANGARATRRVARTPFKVLDAPRLKDDFYLNLVDWSAQNVLAVGLGNCVYLWSAHTSVVTRLCELKFGGPVCSVSWSQSGAELAVGTATGLVQVWDAASCKLVRTMTGHRQRVGCLAWGGALLSSGGRDFDIFNRDMRAREPYVARLCGHRQEVCGLKWSPDDTQLASGGNDNKLLVWSAAGLGCGETGSRGIRGGFATPMLRFTEHEAAVKALAWSPHARGLLASGGGTQDKKIRFWNTLTATPLAAVDTGSQVCNLAWSRNVNELVSTHGYSQNQIVVWKYPTLSKVATLTGHTLRVLYLAVSPSGESIVTGAGDQTLRFWNVFPAARGKRGSAESLSMLSPSRMHIR